MTPELWQRLKPLYNAALDLPVQGRTAYVEQMCDGDPDLARELNALLSANDSAASTLDPHLSQFSLFRPAAPLILEPGTVLEHRFRIVRHLGSGGMGDVYEAVDQQLEPGGRVALKTIRPDIARNPAALTRFKEEVLLARKITGHNICRIHELYVPAPNGASPPIVFLTMEVLEGVTLHDRIAQQNALPLPQMRRIAEQLCTALCCIHESGVLHRDLKPQNIMLVPDPQGERVVVMDFGLARAAAEAAADPVSGYAAPAFVVGTPAYMAPEQFEGREAGPPTDIYALGLIFYEMATGIQPYAAHTPLAAAVRRAQRPRIASSLRTDLPPVWDDVIARCLRYDPAQRFQTATEVMDAWKHPGKVIFRWGKRRRLSVSRHALLAAVVALVALLGVAAWSYMREAHRRKLAPDAARWFTQGMTALHEGSYLKATRLLAEATQRDPTYAVAHAALADAWEELDFTGQAEHEMVLASAPQDQNGLSDLDRRYVDAVRTTLTKNYPAAAEAYQAILDKLPDDTKAQGYLNLARIYEKEGKVRETVNAYEKAASLNPDDPASFLHLGMLHSRLRQPEAAANDFAHAEALYHAESDLEGLAEVAYQRGYAAKEASSYPEAARDLHRSLELAREIPSVQLEVRTLSQLSSLAAYQNQDQQALEYAKQAVTAARDNGLEYWQTYASIWLGIAYMDQENFPMAESLLMEALHNARANAHPRLEAFANLNLASLRNQQKRWDEQISFAQSALKYYQESGFLGSADLAEALILRGERDKGDFSQALQSGTRLLSIAESTHNPVSIALAEELVGNTLLELERYPEALACFQKATTTMQSIGQDPAYQQTHIAETLWQLGRTQEAEAVLSSISPAMRSRSDIGGAIAVLRAEMAQSKGDAKTALDLVRKARATYPGLRADAPDLDRVEALASAQLGSSKQAQSLAAQLAATARGKQNAQAAARAEALVAMLSLRTGDLIAAQGHAEAAAHFFAGKQMLDSEAAALVIAAQCAQAQKDGDTALRQAQRSAQVLGQLEQSWGAPVLQQYASRPDRRDTFRTLAKLNGNNAGLPAALIQ